MIARTDPFLALPSPFDDPRIVTYGIGMRQDGSLDVVTDEADLRRRVAARDRQAAISQSILDSPTPSGAR
jgi:hypothetical protein